MIPLASLILCLAPIPDPPTVLCWVPWREDCCIQVLDEWRVPCNGGNCTGGHTSSHGTHWGTTIATGEAGNVDIQWNVNTDGTHCYYHKATCIDNYCDIDPVETTWDCHQEIPTGDTCQG